MKNMHISTLIVISISLMFGLYDYSLEDINPNSDYYGQNVGTSFFENQVTIHYFGNYN